MYKKANAGHVGCSLSCLEVIMFVKFDWMKAGDSYFIKRPCGGIIVQCLGRDNIISKEKV